MSKFYVMMKRDKTADNIGYTHPTNLVSAKYDPELFAKLSKTFSQAGFSTIESAEAAAKEVSRDLFIYDHTKRAKVMTDFRLYRWWILDAALPIQQYCGTTHWDENGKPIVDKGKMVSLTSIYPDFCAYGLKDAIVKKGKADFSKEADPSNGAIKARAEADHAKMQAEWDNPIYRIHDFAPSSRALDNLPEGTELIHGFGKDSLKLPEEFCIVFPAFGSQFGSNAARELGIDPTSRKKIWFIASYKLSWVNEPCLNRHKYEEYVGTWQACATREEAEIRARLIMKQPLVFKSKKEMPSYVSYLLTSCCGSGNFLYPYQIYRLMVADGKLPPQKKYVKKNAAQPQFF